MGRRAPHVLSVLLAAVLAACAPGAGSAERTAVRRTERIAAGDASLYLEVRGEDRDAPLLLWLHGGPGGAERPLFRLFAGGLEAPFVVAYLDQRGAGRSYDEAA